MVRYYFTFGSDSGYPYQNTYLIVVGTSEEDCINGFRKKYPDRIKGYLNCADFYEETFWKTNEEPVYYKDQEPAEIIWTERCFGSKPEGYDDLFVFIPEAKQIIRIADGSGDNLLREDIKEGYVDYIYYEQYELGADMPEIDGGQILLKELLRDKFKCMADCIPDVLDMAYGNKFTDCLILR